MVTPVAFPRRVFMTQWKDAAGNAVTYTYDSSLRLIAATDAIGQVTTLSYDLSSDPLKITRVTDPFGRFATFDYTSTGRLTCRPPRKSSRPPESLQKTRYATSGTRGTEPPYLRYLA